MTIPSLYRNASCYAGSECVYDMGIDEQPETGAQMNILSGTSVSESASNLHRIQIALRFEFIHF